PGLGPVAWTTGPAAPAVGGEEDGCKLTYRRTGRRGEVNQVVGPPGPVPGEIPNLHPVAPAGKPRLVGSNGGRVDRHAAIGQESRLLRPRRDGAGRAGPGVRLGLARQDGDRRLPPVRLRPNQESFAVRTDRDRANRGRQSRELGREFLAGGEVPEIGFLLGRDHERLSVWAPGDRTPHRYGDRLTDHLPGGGVPAAHRVVLSRGYETPALRI